MESCPVRFTPSVSAMTWIPSCWTSYLRLLAAFYRWLWDMMLPFMAKANPKICSNMCWFQNDVSLIKVPQVLDFVPTAITSPFLKTSFHVWLNMCRIRVGWLQISGFISPSDDVCETLKSW